MNCKRILIRMGINSRSNISGGTVPKRRMQASGTVRLRPRILESGLNGQDGGSELKLPSELIDPALQSVPISTSSFFLTGGAVGIPP